MGIYALVGISERTFTRSFSYKGVKYAYIKIPARTFHGLVSLAYKNWGSLTTFFQLLSACLNYKQRLRNVDGIVTDSRFASYCLSVCKLHLYSWL